MFYALFSQISMWAVFILTPLICLLAFEIGYRIGVYKKHDPDKLHETPLASTVAATLGLFAFILAFTFSLAANRYEERRNLVLEETNAIKTTYLRMGYLEEPQRIPLRKLLKEYLKERIETIQNQNALPGMEKSDQLQNEIWRHAEQIAIKEPHSIPVGLFIKSLNDAIDLHETRIAKNFYNAIPEVIWDILFVIAFLSILGLGYHAGVVGNRFLLVNMVLIVTFSLVMALVKDLETPREGFLQVNERPLIDLYNKWE